MASNKRDIRIFEDFHKNGMLEFSIKLIIFDNVESSYDLVTFTWITLPTLILPLKISSPSLTTESFDSQVKALLFKFVVPSTKTPSNVNLSPFLTTKTSPIFIVWFSLHSSYFLITFLTSNEFMIFTTDSSL